MTCNLCKEGYFLHDNLCDTVCPSKHFKNITARTCDDCHSTCGECEGKLEN